MLVLAFKQWNNLLDFKFLINFSDGCQMEKNINTNNCTLLDKIIIFIPEFPLFTVDN